MVSVSLGPALDARLVPALHGAMGDAIAMGDHLSLDGSEVERVSTMAVQVIVAGGHAMETQGGRFTLQSPSPTLMEGLADLGFGAELDQWKS